MPKANADQPMYACDIFVKSIEELVVADEEVCAKTFESLTNYRMASAMAMIEIHMP